MNIVIRSKERFEIEVLTTQSDGQIVVDIVGNWDVVRLILTPEARLKLIEELAAGFVNIIR